jgi:hypothetical protein
VKIITLSVAANFNDFDDQSTVYHGIFLAFSSTVDAIV